MGTNYYLVYDICSCCGRRETFHLGKSSAGWTFSFHGTDTIRSFSDWSKFVRESIEKGGFIVDEYNSRVDFGELLELIRNKRREKHNHARETGRGSQENWLDCEGNSFSGGWFS